MLGTLRRRFGHGWETPATDGTTEPGQFSVTETVDEAATSEQSEAVRKQSESSQQLQADDEPDGEQLQ